MSKQFSHIIIGKRNFDDKWIVIESFFRAIEVLQLIIQYDEILVWILISAMPFAITESSFSIKRSWRDALLGKNAVEIPATGWDI